MPLPQLPSAFNLNYVMDTIYMRMGGLCRTVEVKGMDMATIIVYQAIPLYSKYFPKEDIVIINPSAQVPGREGFYYVKSDTPIMSVSRAIGLMDTRSTMGTMAGYNAGRNLSTVDTIQTMCSITGSATLSYTLIDHFNLNNYAAASTLPITTRFHPPNIVEFFPKQDYQGAGLVLFTMHKNTLETIGWNMADEFTTCAWLVYVQALKAIFKKYEKIQSIFGEINLDMEQFNSVESDLKDLQEKWRKYSPFRANNKRWYVA